MLADKATNPTNPTKPDKATGREKEMIGLLWFDDDPKRDLKQKVGMPRGATRRNSAPAHRLLRPSFYAERPGRYGDTSAISLEVGGLHLRVIPRRTVLRHHFFISEGGDK